MSQQNVVLLLGSNLGKPEENIAEAITKIEHAIGPVISCTEMMRTEPVEFESANYFCNIALRLETHLSPVKLLNSIKNIEREMGRMEDSSITNNYVDRVIDIDIVEYSSLTFCSSILEIPHYRHTKVRDFSRQLLTELNNLNINM